MSELLPPNPDVSGWHWGSHHTYDPTVLWWGGDGLWWAGSNAVTRADAWLAGYRYRCPIPSPDQLQAMGEVVGLFDELLAWHEVADEDVPDDRTLYSNRGINLTAGMIRRATGQKP